MPKYSELIAACSTLRQKFLQRPVGDDFYPPSAYRRWYTWLDIMRDCFVAEDLAGFWTNYNHWFDNDPDLFSEFFDMYCTTLGVIPTCANGHGGVEVCVDDLRDQFMM